MCNLLNKLKNCALAALGCRRAVAAVEFAMFAPLLALVMVGVFDFGFYINQANNLDKSLRVGAMLAARSSLPLSDDTITTVNNLVKTGTIDGTGDFVVPGWSESSSDLAVTTSTFSSGSTDYEVIRVVATVPYEPIFSNFMESIGFSAITMTAVHEQAYVGN